jgi:16S rRNA (uracil1498-N3)-methyltransferase
MRSFYADPADIEGNRVFLREEEYHHCANVLRLGDGDEIKVVDGRGSEYRVRIKKVDRRGKKILGEIISVEKSPREPITYLALAQGVVKGERMELVLEKATELGIMEIIPMISERSVRIPKKIPERWKKKMISAMKQSGRALLPLLREPKPFEEILNLRQNFEEAYLADPDGDKRLLELPDGKRILIAIGPEGGFTEMEKEMAKNKGFHIFNMGSRTLRSETASMAAISILLAKRGEM